MASPTFSQRDGEVKTALRIYSSEARKNRYRSECEEAWAACPYKLLTPQDSLLPFQFYRPTTSAAIDSWTVYDTDGNEVLDFDSDTIALLIVKRFSGFDAVTYDGDALGEILDAGMYYFTIVTGGVTYWSEDFYVSCSPDGEDIVTDPTFSGGVDEAATWHWGDASTTTTYERLISDVDAGSGPPTDPSLEVTDSRVITIADNRLWVWDGASWIMTAPGSGTYWLDAVTGNWYRFLAGAWVGVAAGSAPVQVTEGTSICWDGTTNHAPLNIVVNGLEVNYRVEFTVTGRTQGTVGVYADDVNLAASSNGTFSFSQYLANGSNISIVPDEDFDGCITSVHAYEQAGLDACHMKLSWTNCGRVGNLYYPGLTNQFYLPLDTIMPRGETLIKVESEEDEQGDEQEVSRRKEVTYSVFLGVVPWYVADALSEMCLHETVRLHYPDGTSDALFHPRVEMDRNEAFNRCLVPCTLKFHLFDSSVACCEEFDAPCLTSCVDADGFEDDTLENGQSYLLNNSPRYAVATSGSLGTPVDCTSGLANIADHGTVLYTVLWDVNSEVWAPIATNTLATAETVDAECVVTLRWTVADGYSGILQYWSADEVWVDDPDWILSADEWSSNTEQRTAPIDQHEDNLLRLKVMCPNGQTVLGYSEEVTYACA